MLPLATADNAFERARLVKTIGQDLGFQQVGITDTSLSPYADKFNTWLNNNYHGEMHYMHRHGEKRYIPNQLHEGTTRVISVRMDYLPERKKLTDNLKDKNKAVISCYAQGRDYHKLMRKRLQIFARTIEEKIAPHPYRVFVDSAPVLEKPLAEKAGLGWIGKHTNLINPRSGSWFFLGEIYTNLPLAIDQPSDTSHCGSCTACIDICPTQAIVAPYQLDARRCISYLTIEFKGSIPIEFRAAIGNRIYGCDDCQLICPWNKFAKITKEKDFYPRANLTEPELADLFAWSKQDFERYTEGSAIRRIGYLSWLRNIAVALGNASPSDQNRLALKKHLQHPADIVREHVIWALEKIGK